jgi:hypothetical protein
MADDTKRPVGRPPNAKVAKIMEKRGVSRATAYRQQKDDRQRRYRLWRGRTRDDHLLRRIWQAEDCIASFYEVALDVIVGARTEEEAGQMLVNWARRQLPSSMIERHHPRKVSPRQPTRMRRES